MKVVRLALFAVALSLSSVRAGAVEASVARIKVRETRHELIQAQFKIGSLPDSAAPEACFTLGSLAKTLQETALELSQLAPQPRAGVARLVEALQRNQSGLEALCNSSFSIEAAISHLQKVEQVIESILKLLAT